MSISLVAWVLPLAGQTAVYRAPRTDGGKPDLNGIWQVLNEANYDIQAHIARAALAHQRAHGKAALGKLACYA